MEDIWGAVKQTRQLGLSDQLSFHYLNHRPEFQAPIAYYSLSRAVISDKSQECMTGAEF